MQNAGLTTRGTIFTNEALCEVTNGDCWNKKKTIKTDNKSINNNKIVTTTHSISIFIDIFALNEYSIGQLEFNYGIFYNQDDK